jgi:hypothetical protein
VKPINFEFECLSDFDFDFDFQQLWEIWSFLRLWRFQSLRWSKMTTWLSKCDKTFWKISTDLFMFWSEYYRNDLFGSKNLLL